MIVHYKVLRYDRTACSIRNYKIATNDNWNKVTCLNCIQSPAYSLHIMKRKN